MYDRLKMRTLPGAARSKRACVISHHNIYTLTSTVSVQRDQLGRPAGRRRCNVHVGRMFSLLQLSQHSTFMDQPGVDSDETLLSIYSFHQTSRACVYACMFNSFVSIR